MGILICLKAKRTRNLICFKRRAEKKTGWGEGSCRVQNYKMFSVWGHFGYVSAKQRRCQTSGNPKTAKPHTKPYQNQTDFSGQLLFTQQRFQRDAIINR